MKKGEVENSIFGSVNQVVIYGANGWMGRSAVDFLSKNVPNKVLSHKLLLIGSKKSQLVINGLKFDIVEPTFSLNQIEDSAIFFNAAFLRREFLQKMPSDDYIKKNQITSF